MNEKLFKIYLAWLDIKNTFVYILSEKPRGLDFARSKNPYPAYSDNARYERTPFSIIKKTMKNTISPDKKILDAGCGKGYFLYSLSKLGYTNLAGLEYEKNIADTAAKNFGKLGLKNIELHNIDASSFTEFDSYDAVYIFNPFRSVVMLAFIKKIEASLNRRPRNFTVIYLNPVEHRFWKASPMFTLIETRPVRKFPHTLEAFYYLHSLQGVGSASFSEILGKQDY